MEDTLHEEPIPEYVEIFDLSDEHDALMEKAGDIQSIQQEMIDNGGVSKQNASDIELLQPGVITGQMPLNGFTTEPSLTNQALAMESAELVSGAVHYALIAGVVLIVAKVFGWMWKAFKDNGQLCQGASAARQRAKAACIVCRDKLHDFHQACSEFPEAYVEKVSRDCEGILPGVTINTPDQALKALQALEKKIIADKLRGNANELIAMAATKPGEYARACKGVEQLVALLPDAVAGLEKLERTLMTNEKFVASEHVVPWPYGIKNAQEAEAYRQNADRTLRSGVGDKDVSEHLSKLNIFQLLDIELHLDELGRIDPKDHAIAGLQTRAGQLSSQGDTINPEHARDPEVKRVVGEWKQLFTLIAHVMSIYRGMAIEARRFNTAVLAASDTILNIYTETANNVIREGKGAEGTDSGVVEKAKKRLGEVVSEISKVRKEAPRVAPSE